MLRAVLSLLIAWSSVQQRAELRPAATQGCVEAGPCAPLEAHRLSLGDAITAPIAFAPRLAIHNTPLIHRAGSDPGVRGGLDVLFRDQTRLQCARALVARAEHRSISGSLHAAAQNTASAPTRAPPHHS